MCPQTPLVYQFPIRMCSAGIPWNNPVTNDMINALQNVTGLRSHPIPSYAQTAVAATALSPKWRERRCPGRLSRRPRSTSRQLGDSLCTGAWTWNTREARFGLPRYRVKLREAWGGKKTFQWPVFHPHIDNHWNWLSKSEFVNVWLRNPFLYRKKRFQGNPL
jgi:hypothetical protein